MRSRLRFPIIVLAILVVALVAVPWLRDPETKRLDAPNVAEFPGSYVLLDNGYVRYLLEGPENAETVLLVGGLTTSLEFFDDTARFLNDAGFRTLRFDLYGRGGSARPADVAYDRQTFVQQIDSLLDHLTLHQKIHVVGQSLGGGISVAWAVENPQKVRSLSIHASAGYVPELPTTAAVLNMPGLGDYVWWNIGNGFIDGDLGKYFPDPDLHAAKIERLGAQFDAAEQYKGYRRAILTTIRNFRAHDMSAEFSRLDANEIPVMMVWGQLDTVIPIEAADTLIEWMQGTPDFVRLDGVGHMPLIQAPEETLDLLLKHIKEH